MMSPNLRMNTANASVPKNAYLEGLLEPLLLGLMDEFNHYQNHSELKDENYQVWEYGEIAHVSYLTHALRRMDPNFQRFVFMQEVSLEGELREARGRADLIIQDLTNNTAVIIEAKKYFSKPYAPVKHWRMDVSDNYYKKVMKQCSSYFTTVGSKLSTFKDIYLLTMSFDSVKFIGKDKQYFKKWYEYESRFQYEYYYFFSDNDEEYGLAVYGTYKKKERNNP